MALIGVIVGYGVAVATTPGGIPTSGDAVVPVPSSAAPTPTAPSNVPTTNANLPPVDAKNDHIRGNKGAAVSIIEYSDYECPFCKRHHPTLVQAMKDIPGINWVYRHYPLDFHPTAMPAAIASECVYELKGDDAFWSFTDSVFSEGSDTSKLADYAVKAGVDKTAFESCVKSNRTQAKVTAQETAGSAAGVRGTPANFIINNKTGKSVSVTGAQSLDAIKAAVEQVQ